MLELEPPVMKPERCSPLGYELGGKKIGGRKHHLLTHVTSFIDVLRLWSEGA